MFVRNGVVEWRVAVGCLVLLSASACGTAPTRSLHLPAGELLPPESSEATADDEARSDPWMARSVGRRPQEGDLVFAPTVGVLSSPDAFLIGGQLDYYLGQSLSLGPALQVGVSDDETVVAGTMNWKWLYHLAEEGDWSRIRPFLQGGAGFAYIEKERRGRSDDDEVGLLVNGGAGIELLISDHLSLGSSVLLNVMPTEVAGEDTFFSWQVFQLGFRF